MTTKTCILLCTALAACGGSKDPNGGTASGKFDVTDAHVLEDILKWTPAELTQHVIPFLKLKQYE